MPPSRRSTPRTVALALLLTTVSAAPGDDAGDDATTTALWRMVADAPAVPRIDGVTWSGAIDLNAGAVGAQPGDGLRLDLPDGPVIVTIERRAAAAPGRFILAGRPAIDAPGGVFLLAVHRTGVAGVLRLGAAGTYRIRGHADGSIQLERLDEAAMPWCGQADAPGLDAAAAAAGGAASPGEGCDDGSVIDILMLYTLEARDAAGGTDSILAEIDLMVEYMNTGFVISNVNPRMHIVYSWEITTPQNQIGLQNLAGRDDGVIDGIHDLRNLYGGDQVALVVRGGGGVAMGLWTLDPEMEANMFCINGRDTMPFIVAHEVGHNLGCCHARGDGGGCPPEGGLLFPFSNGHRFFGDSGDQWRTIMAYPPGVLSAHYSNPDVLFDGVPTGVPEEEPDSADNAQTINLAAFTVSNWRCNDEICEGLELPSDAADCNENEIPDLCEIAQGLGEDVNGDGILDECQCMGDVDGSGAVDIGDILAILSAWGNKGGPEDLDGSGFVDFGDLLIVLAAWGPCIPPTPADDCADAPDVSEGVYFFSTLEALTDGPTLPEECNQDNGRGCRKDVWIMYIASCDGVARASVCDGTFDTCIAVYEDGDCPGPFLACNNDACGEEGTRSEVSFPVQSGGRYLIRIGSPHSERGEGTLVIDCAE